MLLSQLLTPETEAAFLSVLEDILEAEGFEPRSWNDNGVKRALLRGIARICAKAGETVSAVARGYLLGLARGMWLDLLGQYVYGGEQRLLAIAARRFVNITNGPSPSVIGSDLTLSVGSAGQTWRRVGDTSPIALAALASASAEFECEILGEAGNLPDDTAIALPSIAGSSAVFGVRTREGVEKESDDRYTRRLELVWTRLSYAIGDRAIEKRLLDNMPQITGVRVLSDRQIVIRRFAATATAEDITQAEGLLTTGDFMPRGFDVLILPAVEQTINVTATPRVVIGGSSAAEMKKAIEHAIRRIRIGGIAIGSGSGGFVLPEYLAVAITGNQCGDRTDIPQTRNVLSAGILTPSAPIAFSGSDMAIVGEVEISPTYVPTAQW